MSLGAYNPTGDPDTVENTYGKCEDTAYGVVLISGWGGGGRQVVKSNLRTANELAEPKGVQMETEHEAKNQQV